MKHPIGAGAAAGPPAVRAARPGGWRPAGSGHAGVVGRPEAEVRIAAGLRVFLAPRHRGGRVRVTCDGTSSLGHVVESLGVPLPEVGSLTVNGRPVVAGYRLNGGDVAGVRAMRRPPRLPSARVLLARPPAAPARP